MTNETLENNLNSYYARFNDGHDRQREQLLASLEQVQRQPAPVRRWAAPLAVKKIAAIAACLVIILGGVYMLNGGDQSQEVFAQAINQFNQVQSVHLRMVTPNPNAEASVEMWWRRPHDFRMEFGDGTIMAANSENRYELNSQNRKVEISENTGPGFENFILAQLGGFFGEDRTFAQDWIDSSEIIQNEPVVYKGQNCRRIFCHNDNQWYEYVIDTRADGNKQAPFYEVDVYGDAEKNTLLCHIEVLEVDADMPDRLFRIDRRPQVK